MSVLVIAPHPDDESIGCGGSILRHVERGEDVRVLFLTSGELGVGGTVRERAWEIREREAEVAARVLGVEDVQFLRQPDWHLGEHVHSVTPMVGAVMTEQRPKHVYAPHANEWHPDHRAAHAIALGAAALSGVAPSQVLAYEVWTPLAFYDEVADISSLLSRKLEAVRCYETQLGAFDYVRAVSGLAQYRGAMAAHSDYAEVFGRCG